MIWEDYIKKESKEEYFKQIKEHLENSNREEIYPPKGELLNAFRLTEFDDVKVIIVGQDPYYGEGQANGLAFSVKKGIKIPPSLKNIFKELNSDINIDIPGHGDLTDWAQQGVFLINNSLSVIKSKPNSHSDIGWKIFTNRAIKSLSDDKENLVFILWGKMAGEKERLIDRDKHLIIKSTHPSPFSAHSGFFGSKPFSQCNEYLVQHDIEEIDWNIYTDKHYGRTNRGNI